VTCLCITRNRRQWLPKAIANYRALRHASSELLIIADGDDVRDLVPEHDPRIRLIHVEEPNTVGDKRNYGCERARGFLIAHWDDDDYSAPDRIRAQVRTLAASGKSVTGFRSMRFTDGDSWWMYSGDENFALGTSLMYRRGWWERNRFMSLQVGEDNYFVNEAAGAGELVTAEAGDLMYATLHPQNTSPKNKGSAWTRIT